MATRGGGGGRRPRKKPQPKTSRGPQGLPTQSTSRQRPVQKSRPLPKSQPGPIRQTERRAVEQHKKTPAYRGAVRAAYKTQSLGKRKARIRAAEDQQKPGRKQSAESKAILHQHRSEVARNLVLKRGRARFTGAPSSAESKQIERFKLEGILSKKNQEEVYKQEWRKTMEGPRGLPGQRKNMTAVLAGVPGVKLGGTEKMVDQTVREKAQAKIADKAFKAGASEEQVNKALTQLAKRHKSPALTVLEQFTRPSSAVAGAVQSLKKGESPAVGAAKGFVKNDQRFAKVIGGKNPSTGEEVAGFVLDVAFDPTTYVTLGTARPAMSAARKAAREAAHKATKDAVEAAVARGLSREQAEKAVREGRGRVDIERAVNEAAQQAWKKNGGKGKGVTVGLRGTPVQAVQTARKVGRGVPLRDAVRLSSREVKTSGRTSSRLVGSPIRRVTERLPKTLDGDDTAQIAADAADTVLKQLVHSYRPRAFNDWEWERMTGISRQFRAGVNRAERQGENRWLAYQHALERNDIPKERHRAIVDALEADDLSTLSKGEREVAEAMQRDLAEMHRMEVAAGVRGQDEAVRNRGDRQVEDLPDIKQSRKDRDKVRREAAAAEREVRAATEELIHAQGRAEVLSRNVAGRRGETAAERAKRIADKVERKAGTTGRPSEVLRLMDEVETRGSAYAAGGHGVRSARERLQKAEKTREKAMTKLREVEAGHAKTIAQRQVQRMRNAEAVKPKAKGYVPRFIRSDYAEERSMRTAGVGQPSGTKVNSTSTKGRRDQAPLAMLQGGKRDRFIDDIPTLMGERTAESFRLQNLGKLNDEIAGLAVPVRSVDELDIGDDIADAMRFYARGPRGDFTPLWRTVDTVDQLRAGVVRAVERGDEVLEIPRATMQAVWDLNRRGRVAKSGEDNALGAVWDATQRKWKWLVTQPNPGYHVRNILGDAWNARLGGATAGDLSKALDLVYRHRSEIDDLSQDIARAIAKPVEPTELRRGGKKDMKIQGEVVSDATIVLLAEQHGVVRSGFTGKELQDLRHGREIRKQGKVARNLQAFSESREDIMRMASFIRALKRGDSPEEAASWANKHHFDYGDLTPFEVNTLRRLIPFYTFMARNTPLQLASLMMSPGRFATLEKARNTTEQIAGLPDDWEATLPEFVQQSVPFAVPRTKPEGVKVGGVNLPLSTTGGLPMYATPMLPVTDLNNVHPVMLGKRIMSSVTPLIKLPLELFTKYDFYYRDKIRKDLVPAPSWWPTAGDPVKRAFSALAFAIPGVDQPTFDAQIRDRRTGKEVPAWPWWLDKLARSTPITGMVAGASTPGREKRPGEQSLTVMNWMSGVRRAAIDPAEAYTAQLFEDLDAIDDELNMAKQRSTKHKAGEPWPSWSKVGKLNKRKAEVIDELRKVTGEYADPYFARQESKASKDPLERKLDAAFGTTKKDPVERKLKRVMKSKSKDPLERKLEEALGG